MNYCINQIKCVLEEVALLLRPVCPAAVCFVAGTCLVSTQICLRSVLCGDARPLSIILLDTAELGGHDVNLSLHYFKMGLCVLL